MWRKLSSCACGLLAAWYLWPLDGVLGSLLSLLDRDDTEYAEGYSDWGFRNVHAGMSIDDVREKLGPPLEEYLAAGHDGTVYSGWRYSRARHGGSYRIRSLLIHEGRVSDVFHEFYLD